MTFPFGKEKVFCEAKKCGLRGKRTFGTKFFRNTCFDFRRDIGMRTSVWGRESLYGSRLAVKSGAFGVTWAGS